VRGICEATSRKASSIPQEVSAAAGRGEAFGQPDGHDGSVAPVAASPVHTEPLPYVVPDAWTNA
jgi:hypothetical protein